MFAGSGSCLIEIELLTSTVVNTCFFTDIERTPPTTDSLVEDETKRDEAGGFEFGFCNARHMCFDPLVESCGVCSCFCAAEHHVRSGIDVKD